MNTSIKWQGLFVAITTPFTDDGAFDADSYARHIEFLIENGVDGLVPCGTTGEAATLSDDEFDRVVRLAVETVDNRIPVVAGVGSNATSKTVTTAGRALDAGVDALLVVTPYYNKPTQEGMFQHFSHIARETDAPIVVYNVPGRTASNIFPETIARLAQLPQIVAVKEATADLRVASQIVQLCSGQVSLFSGDDFTAFPLIAIGGEGVISVVGNVAPRKTKTMVDAALSGDYDTARKLHHELMPLTALLFKTANPIPIKRAVSLIGFGTGNVRLPLVPLGEEATAELDEAIRALEL